MYDMSELKSEINKLYNKGNDLNLLGITSLNDEGSYFLPYTLYFELDGHFLSITVSTDILVLNKFNSIEDLVKDIDMHYQENVFIRKDYPNSTINKRSPFINMIDSDIHFDLLNALWNEDFLIIKKTTSKNYAVFLSEDYEEVTPAQFLMYMTDKINEFSEEKINDFERLSILEYNKRQINEIIKSKSIYDIEPLVNINTPEDLMAEYNRTLKRLNPDDFDAFRQCVLLNCDFSFLIDGGFNKAQKDVIKQHLDNNVPYNKIITNEFPLDKMDLAYQILSKNPECTHISPTFSNYRLSLMCRPEYMWIEDLVTDDFDENKLDIYLFFLQAFPHKQNEKVNWIREYVSDEYEVEQLRTMFDLLCVHNCDKEVIDFLMKDFYDYKQIKAIEEALKDLDVKQLDWLTSEYTSEEINEIVKKIIKGQDYRKLLKDYKSLDEIIAEKMTKIKKNFSKNNDKER